jgi:hypothetical protein
MMSGIHFGMRRDHACLTHRVSTLSGFEVDTLRGKDTTALYFDARVLLCDSFDSLGRLVNERPMVPRTICGCIAAPE